jgi:glycosyltransferase involved in cell wall biosynthesis
MDMLATPTLSVIVPTYNRCESLRITLDALQRQDFPRERFEVVVVSDGSTDGTEAFLRDYAAASPMTLRPIFQQNGGPARARNRGIQEARNEIVLFIDDDVEPLPGFLSAHAAHHADDDCVVVIGPMSPDPARARQEPVWVAWEHAMLGKQYESFASGAWPTAGPHHFYTGNSSLRRAHLLAVGGFDESFKRQEDVEMAYRMQRQCGVRFVFDSAPDGIHRPQRAFASWLKVAYEYGRLDVVRAGRGDVSWALLRLCYRAPGAADSAPWKRPAARPERRRPNALRSARTCPRRIAAGAERPLQPSLPRGRSRRAGGLGGAAAHFDGTKIRRGAVLLNDHARRIRSG